MVKSCSCSQCELGQKKRTVAKSRLLVIGVVEVTDVALGEIRRRQLFVFSLWDGENCQTEWRVAGKSFECAPTWTFDDVHMKTLALRSPLGKGWKRRACLFVRS